MLLIAEVPGVASGNLNKIDFLTFVTPHGFPQKNCANLVQPFGHLYLTYVYYMQTNIYRYIYILINNIFN